MIKLKTLRLVGTLEAISYLLLLGVAMPLKYMADWPLGVEIVGALHGGLFLLFVGMVTLSAYQRKWPFRWVIEAFIASILPFGPFVWDRRRLRPLERTAE